MSRRFLIITIFLIIVFAIAFIFYLGWRRVGETPTTASEGELSEVVTTPPTETTEGAEEIDESELSFYNKEMGQPALSHDKTRLAVLEREAGGIFLKIKDAKTNATQRRVNLNLEDVDLAWANTNEILLIEKPSAALNNSIFRFNLKTGGLDYFNRGERGLVVKLFDGGDKLLTYSEDTATLSLINQKNKSSLNLPFLTLPTKCAYQNNTFYCAVPDDVPLNISFPDDYLKRKFYSKDSIVSLNLKENSIKTILGGEGEKVDAVNLLATDDNLYFTNRYDNKVYKLKLQ